MPQRRVLTRSQSGYFPAKKGKSTRLQAEKGYFCASSLCSEMGLAEYARAHITTLKLQRPPRALLPLREPLEILLQLSARSTSHCAVASIVSRRIDLRERRGAFAEGQFHSYF